MKKFKYLKISKTRKLRYMDNYYKKKLYIIFLPGFMSDIEGKKPQILKSYAKKKKLGFLAIEYSGHGKSSGEFVNGNISSWTKDVKISIKKIVKKKEKYFLLSKKNNSTKEIEINTNLNTELWGVVTYVIHKL